MLERPDRTDTPTSRTAAPRAASRKRRRLVLPMALTVLALASLPAGAANHQVTVQNTFFSPANLTIQVGDTVTWTNQGGTHNVTADDGSFRCANGCDGTGGDGNISSANWSFTLTFNDPGTIAYFCQLHGGAGGSGMSGSVTVQGGDTPGNLRFPNATLIANESDGQILLTVQRVDGDDGAVTVQYATSDGSATAGSDYTATSGTLSWPDNDDDPKSFFLPILEDSIEESNETINLTLSNPTGGAGLANPSTATVIIADNDQGSGSAGGLAFTSGTFQVGEASGNAAITVSRDGGSDGSVSVDYTTGNGSATAGGDYTATSGTLSWADGEVTDKSFDVPIVEDGEAESSETVNLTLSNPTGGATLGNPSAATLTILDNDSIEPGPCVEDGNTLCLHDGRFRVRVLFRPPGGQLQPGNAIPFTTQSGLFWFFTADNVEMLIKVLDACVNPFNRYWVFYSATTNVELTVTVDDLDALQQNVYGNPQGMLALPVADTQAFATCP